MLVACRLAGLNALEGHYANINARTQRAPTRTGFAGAGAGLRRWPPRAETPGCRSATRAPTCASKWCGDLGFGSGRRETLSPAMTAVLPSRPVALRPVH